MALRDQLLGQVSGTEPLSQFDPWFSMDRLTQPTNPLGLSSSIFNTMSPSTSSPLRNALVGTDSPLAGLAGLGDAGGGGGMTGMDTGGPTGGSLGTATAATGPSTGPTDMSTGMMGTTDPSPLANALGIVGSLGLSASPLGPAAGLMGVMGNLSSVFGGPNFGPTSLIANALGMLGMNNQTPITSLDPMIGFNPMAPMETPFDPVAWNELVQELNIEPNVEPTEAPPEEEESPPEEEESEETSEEESESGGGGGGDDDDGDGDGDDD